MSIYLNDGNNLLLRDLARSHHDAMSLRGRYDEACSQTDTHFWVFDGKDHNERRRATYPPYKAQREPMAEDRFAHIRLFKELLQHSHAIYVECDGWEADDAIATLARYFSKTGREVVIRSNDLDFGQLAGLPGVTLKGVKELPCEPNNIPIYKATRGDPADNIAGIPGFGPKTWEALSPDEIEELEYAILEADFEALRALPLPPRVVNQFADPKAFEPVQAMLQIVHFLAVPNDELKAGMKVGTFNRAAADARLREFFL